MSPAADSTLARFEAARDLDGNVVGHTDAPTVVVVMASWCHACRAELAVFDRVRVAHPRVRFFALNYKDHEEYAARGSSHAIRELARGMPWLRIVPADDKLFAAFGQPSKIPTVVVFDRMGGIVAHYNRHDREPPDEAELDQLLARLR